VGGLRNANLSTFAAFRFRNFRLLWIGALCSNAANWIQQITVGWVVYDLTGSGLLVGAVTGARSVSLLGLGPLAGVLADRLPPRLTLLALNLFLLLLTLTIGVALAAGQTAIWPLFLFMVLFGAAQTLEHPLRQTMTFAVVPRASIPNAMGLMTGAFSMMRTLGPAVGGGFIVLFGPSGNFFLQSAAYFLAGLTILLILVPSHRQPARAGSLLRDFIEGARAVLGQQDARIFWLVSFIHPLFLIASFTATAPIFAKDVFHGGPQTLGLLLSSVGLGGVLGALFTASLQRIERWGVLLLLALMFSSLALFGFAFSPSVSTAVLLLVAAGFFEVMNVTINHTLLQLAVPDEVRGRVTSLSFWSHGTFPVGALVAGAAADVWGPRAVVAAMSGAAVLLAVTIALRVPRLRMLRLSEMTARVGGEASGHRL
jgi:MFS family permease